MPCAGCTESVNAPCATLLALLLLACALSCHPRVPHSVTLTWQAPELAKGMTVVGYNVYRKPSDGGKYQKIATGIHQPSYEDHHVQSGKTYIYAVTTVDGFGRESALSEVARSTIPSP